MYVDHGVVAGAFVNPPAGVILHGSRSGRMQTIHQEFEGTRHYAVGEPNGYGWNATVGEDELSIHMSVREWGWSARTCSRLLLAVELAQPLEMYPISDAHVRAVVWWLNNEVFPTWTHLRQTILDDPLHALPSHAEVERWGWTGAKDGKTDAFSYGSAHTDDLRNRIVALL